MTKKTCPLGEDCDLTVAWMAGRESAKDEAQAMVAAALKREGMIRICPKRDRVCPHGMDCPYVLHRYDCKPEPGDKGHPEKSPDKPISGDV